eukprot:scaffold116102_cov36-Prasinocladus_malaysianus.AAC.3
MSSKLYFAFQPSSFSASAVPANTASASPGRLFATLYGMVVPLARSHAFTTSSTLEPTPVPRL